MEAFWGFPTLEQPMPNRESSTSASYFTAFSSGQSLPSSVPPPSPFPLAALLLPKAPFSKVGRHPQDAHKFHRSLIEVAFLDPHLELHHCGATSRFLPDRHNFTLALVRPADWPWEKLGRGTFQAKI